ncbi:hypothetical protein F4820DRAFT_406492 [Hypoxylon rubiginosum]|uniref:Uncharacterized protein n=1 Tax=Hypoxylon rubiginosum TaxID=110542 RepID=A0ACB9ZCD9_9PEZI|nr:hypothetical protein F4820DRAFT_406492 [Hypoxylon rubiginosum]
MLLRVSRSNRLQASRNQVCSRRMATHGTSTACYSPRALFTSVAARAAVKVDQTKKSNDPSQDLKEEHHKQATQTTSSDHPAKQPDLQQSPSKSTGIRSEGPGSTKAGEGTDKGVHKDKEIEGGQHDNYPYTI